jgi:hypothetical protein
VHDDFWDLRGRAGDVFNLHSRFAWHPGIITKVISFSGNSAENHVHAEVRVLGHDIEPTKFQAIYPIINVGQLSKQKPPGVQWRLQRDA